jgi:hypothetical protein
MHFEIGKYYKGNRPDVYTKIFLIFLVLEVGDSGWVRAKVWVPSANYGNSTEKWLNTNYLYDIQEIEDIKKQFPDFPR